MNGEQINQKIRFGYAKAAEKLGEDFSLYRSNSPIDPINNGNLIGVIKAVSTLDWEWMKSNKSGNPFWNLVVDGQASSYPLSAELGDYLISSSQTLFVFLKDYQLPIRSVQCTEIITIKRPFQSTDPGYNGYAAYLPQTSELICQNIPVSILSQGKGTNENTDLPTDGKSPLLIILMPTYDNLLIKTGDIITDSKDKDYIISLAEISNSGWRMTASEVVF